jgi:hypothetical protein
MAEFSDPIGYKQRSTSRDFVAPRKEQATTGRFMDAGDDYGVGFKVKVGSFKVSDKSPIPQKAHACDPQDAIRG